MRLGQVDVSLNLSAKPPAHVIISYRLPYPLVQKWKNNQEALVEWQDSSFVTWKY